MPYIHVADFSGGLDDRKSEVTAPPGTLVYLNNAHLTAGGEIEKRKAFVPVHIFQPDTQCLGGWPGVGTIWLWGNGARPATLPAEFTWVRVEVSGTWATRLVRAVPWGGTPRALVEYPDGSRRWWAGAVLVDTDNAAVWNWPGLDPKNTQDFAVLQQKLYTVQGSILEASGVAEPEKHGSGVTGSALFDASMFGPEAYDLVAMAIYQNRLITFGKNGAVVWQVDPDPAMTTPLQFLTNFGCAAPRTIVNYGEADTFFLSYSGVRSVRARDSSNLATIQDVGSPINNTVGAHLNLLLGADKLARAVGAYEPRDGRYWLAMYDAIYVLSWFPGSKVTGWSTYTPGFPVVDMFSRGNDMFVLSQDTLYSVGAYQGNAASDYDRTVVEVDLPYLCAGDPATMKTWTGMDVACEGKWVTRAAFRLAEPRTEEVLSVVEGPTYDEGAHPMVGDGTHIKVRLSSDFDGYAKLSDLALHYVSQEAA